MPSLNLKKYMKEMLYLEQTLYEQNTLIERLTNEITKQSQIVGPQVYYSMEKPVEPQKPPRISHVWKLFIEEIFLSIIIDFWVGIVGLVVGGIVGILFIFIIGAKYYLLFPFSGFIIGFIAGVAYVIHDFVEDIDRVKRAEYDYNKSLAIYKHQTKMYAEMEKNAHIKANKINRVKKEINIPILSQQLRSVTESRNNTYNTLRQLYDLDVIHPKYRNIVAVASFCEYLETGRCTTLEGHEGAVNIYEQEVRLDRVITQLDDVLHSLNKIKRNQFTLYTMIEAANERIFDLLENTSSGLSSISSAVMNTQSSIDANTRALNENLKHTALVEYNTNVIARNTEILAGYRIL